MFRLSNVSKKYVSQGIETCAINGITMELDKKIIAIVGRSGSGKTTLLNLLSTNDDATEGEIYYNDMNLVQINDKEKELLRLNRFGFVFQQFELIQSLNVHDNIVLPAVFAKKKMDKDFYQLGYQGNNLLCSNWDINHMKKIDFNGLYEYLYAMKYKKKFNEKRYQNGIPKEEFEQLIMEYMPVSVEEIQKYAVYNKKKKTYDWMRLGCFNYAPNFFGTSIPEVTNIKHNPNGTITLTVDAVCEMVLCNEAVITHELTVKFAKDGSFKYLGNKILNNGIEEIPTYQYRICKG